jgi:hypothetical protein
MTHDRGVAQLEQFLAERGEPLLRAAERLHLLALHRARTVGHHDEVQRPPGHPAPGIRICDVSAPAATALVIRSAPPSGSAPPSSLG